MANHAGKAVDVAVYGATGFTGRLVAEYLAKTYPSGSSLIWAMITWYLINNLLGGYVFMEQGGPMASAGPEKTSFNAQHS